MNNVVNLTALRNGDEMRGLLQLGVWLRLAIVGALVAVAAIVSMATGGMSASSGLIGAGAGSLLAVLSGRKFFDTVGNEQEPSTPKPAPVLAQSRA